MQPTFDEHWHKRAIAGDARAVSDLAAQAIEPLYRFCLYRVGKDSHLCEDVVQETMVQAIRQIEGYDPARSGGNIFPWLTGLARNQIRRALADAPAAAGLQTLWEGIDKDLLRLYSQLESRPLEDELLQREQTRDMVNVAMSQLPPNYGAALEAKYLHGQSVRQIAAAWRTTEKAVESTLTRARAAFRETFLALCRNLSSLETTSDAGGMS